MILLVLVSVFNISISIDIYIYSQYINCLTKKKQQKVLPIQILLFAKFIINYLNCQMSHLEIKLFGYNSSTLFKYFFTIDEIILSKNVDLILNSFLHKIGVIGVILQLENYVHTMERVKLWKNMRDIAILKKIIYFKGGIVSKVDNNNI